MLRARGCGGRCDRGAALVELALVLPFLALLVFGMTEMSLTWVSNNRVEGAAAQATRVGATSGDRVEADRDILVALQASLPAGELARLDRVVVFTPLGTEGAVPSGCIKPMGDPSEIGTSTCNTYTGATARAVSATSMSGFGGGPSDKDRFWAPAVRQDSLIDPPDYLGVWIRTSHEGLTSLAFAHLTVTEASVYRIQPDLIG